MSRIRSGNTGPELLVRKFLFLNGLRYRLHKKDLPGKPDIVLSKYNTVVFVHGCFWHGHEDCKHYTVPKTRPEWWVAKINKNKENDLRHAKESKKLGWRVIVVHECELKPKKRDKTLLRILKKIKVGYSDH